MFHYTSVILKLKHNYFHHRSWFFSNLSGFLSLQAKCLAEKVAIDKTNRHVTQRHNCEVIILWFIGSPVCCFCLAWLIRCRGWSLRAGSGYLCGSSRVLLSFPGPCHLSWPCWMINKVREHHHAAAHQYFNCWEQMGVLPPRSKCRRKNGWLGSHPISAGEHLFTHLI